MAQMKNNWYIDRNASEDWQGALAVHSISMLCLCGICDSGTQKVRATSNEKVREGAKQMLIR